MKLSCETENSDISRKDAHKLIEEFMLLGNAAVAEKIHKTSPDLAFLRCHPPNAKNNVSVIFRRTNVEN